MNINLESSWVKWPIFGVGVTLLVGSVLDALSNSVAWISPSITYIGTMVVLGVGVILLILDKRQILNLNGADGNRRNDVDWHLLGIILGLMLILWLPRITTKTGMTFGTSTQTGVVEVQSLKKIETFYPKKFTSPPHLTFPTTESDEFCRKMLTVIEQRADGFKTTTDTFSSSSPCFVKWLAEGRLAE